MESQRIQNITVRVEAITKLCIIFTFCLCDLDTLQEPKVDIVFGKHREKL
jgi:hypothetical protein